jgi:hypothetical protein
VKPGRAADVLKAANRAAFSAIAPLIEYQSPGDLLPKQQPGYRGEARHMGCPKINSRYFSISAQFSHQRRGSRGALSGRFDMEIDPGIQDLIAAQLDAWSSKGDRALTIAIRRRQRVLRGLSTEQRGLIATFLRGLADHTDRRVLP